MVRPVLPRKDTYKTISRSNRTMQCPIYLMPLLLAMFIIGAGAQCTDVTGCFCFSGYVTCSGLRSFPSRFPLDTTMITISNMETEEIPANVLNTLPVLTNFEIHASNITRISSASFAGLADIELISLNKLRIGTIENGAFYNLTNIGMLTIYSSTIDTVEPYAFTDVFAIDEFSILSSDIRTVEPFAFYKISDVYKLSLNNNNATSVKPYALSEITDIYHFEMFLNSIGSLGCNNVDSIIEDAYESSFYSNSVECTCKMAWVLDNPSIRDQMFLNWCNIPGSSESVYWNLLDKKALFCQERDDQECPTVPNRELPQSTPIVTSSFPAYQDAVKNILEDEFKPISISGEHHVDNNMSNTLESNSNEMSTKISQDSASVGIHDVTVTPEMVDAVKENTIMVRREKVYVGNADFDTGVTISPEKASAVKETETVTVQQETARPEQVNAHQSEPRTDSLIARAVVQNQATAKSGNDTKTHVAPMTNNTNATDKEVMPTRETDGRHKLTDGGGFYVHVRAEKASYQHDTGNSACSMHHSYAIGSSLLASIMWVAIKMCVMY